MISLQATGHQGLLATTKIQERHAMDSPSNPQDEPSLPTSWCWTPGLQNCDRINFCCFKPPSSSIFVIAALGNEYICLITKGSCRVYLIQDKINVRKKPYRVVEKVEIRVTYIDKMKTARNRWHIWALSFLVANAKKKECNVLHDPLYLWEIESHRMSSRTWVRWNIP